MNGKIRRWLPIALCCLPGIVVAASVGIGVALGGATFGVAFGGPLGFGLLALALLACPLSMGLMMMRGASRKAAYSDSTTVADCCAPDEQNSTIESDRLTRLCARREALEREVAELQAQSREA